MSVGYCPLAWLAHLALSVDCLKLLAPQGEHRVSYVTAKLIDKPQAHGCPLPILDVLEAVETKYIQNEHMPSH